MAILFHISVYGKFACSSFSLFPPRNEPTVVLNKNHLYGLQCSLRIKLILCAEFLLLNHKFFTPLLISKSEVLVCVCFCNRRKGFLSAAFQNIRHNVLQPCIPPCTLFFRFTPCEFSPLLCHCTSTITLQPPAEVRESSVLSSSAPGSLKDIDSSDLCVTALPPTVVRRGSCSMLQCAANFPRLSTPRY